MDDKNQNLQIPQPQTPEPQVPSTGAAAPLNQNSQKAIQPSEELKKDMAANPDGYYSRNPAPHVSAVPNAQSPNSTLRQTQAPSTTYNPSAIYPETTGGLPEKPTNEVSHGDNQSTSSNDDKLTKLIIIGVIALGVFIAVPALLSIIGWAKIISYGNINALGKTGVLIYTIDAIYLIVGVGLILRKEFARITYVVIGVILLLIGLYGTINYFRESHSISGVAAYYTEEVASAQTGVNGDQTTISSYQNNTSIPASQKQQIISELEGNLKQDQQQLKQLKQLQKQNSGISSLVKLIPTYLLAILPLVFLTRPRVKEVFS